MFAASSRVNTWSLGAGSVPLGAPVSLGCDPGVAVLGVFDWSSSRPPHAALSAALLAPLQGGLRDGAPPRAASPGEPRLRFAAAARQPQVVQ